MNGPTDDTGAIYDEHAAFYVDFIDRWLAVDGALLYVLLATFDELLGDRVKGASVLDVACGQGYVSRHLAERGVGHVVGIDLSAELIEVAKTRTESSVVQFRVDDAQQLHTIDDGACDVVVSQLALMDIADHVAAFRSVRRVLRGGGLFVFSVLHPALEGAPFQLPDAPRFLYDDTDTPIAYIVARYATEGFWRSGGTGVRGRVGSHHRTVSTYINDLLRTGFVIEQAREPVVPGTGLAAEVPQTMVFAARAAAR
jgi:ubiquinone/menaquinone biosynthesis C-methylase UbiE